MAWRKPETAPRDGTIIVGLFKRAGRRAISALAAFDTSEPGEGSGAYPEWVNEGIEAHKAQLRDPVALFRPLGDGNETAGLGRMIGWRPARKDTPND